MAGVSKLDYLKKYMNNTEEKKIKKKKVKKHGNIKIIDNSISFSNKGHLDNNAEDDGSFDLKEEKPIVYAKDGTTVLTEEYEEQERLKKERWKTIGGGGNQKNGDSQLHKKGNIRGSQQRHDSSDDDDDLSPVRRKTSDVDRDLSPPRRRPVQGGDSPPRKKSRAQRHDSSDDDLSPKRQRKQDSVKIHDSDGDLSPVRRGREGRRDSDQDLSPVRKRKTASDDDLSPVRSNIDMKDSKCKTDSKWSKDSKTRTESHPEVLSKGKAGLSSGAELRLENDIKRRREREAMGKLDSDLSGKGAETIHRDKSGRKIDMKLEAIQKRKAEEEKLQREEKYAKWGKGLAQGENQKKQLQDDLHEMEKPLARYKDDEDLDKLLREKERADDPMAEFLAKKSQKEQMRSNKPKYTGKPCPNRFNIWPGYRWDGVDRSNGFEKRRYEEMSKRKGLKDAAYKWSVEDM